MKKLVAAIIVSTFTLASSLGFAHGRYILPTHTVLSTNGAESIGLISSISNDVYHADLPLGDNGKGTVPKDLENMFRSLKSILLQPDGVMVEGPSWQSFSRFSAADLTLEQAGTYRLSLVQPATAMTTFKHSDGSPGRVFGPNPKLPEGAKGTVYRMVSSRVETFISKNSPNRLALKPVAGGLALGGATHPNDLFVDERVSFSLTYDGQPLSAKTQVHLVREGTRHRNQRNEIKVKTDEFGHFSLVFSESGFYLLEAEVEFEAGEGDAMDVYHHSLYVTLEVFPQ